MSIVVPDASLILKWVVPSDNEPYVEQALALREAFIRDEISLQVPSLWYFEEGNTLARKFPEVASFQLRHLCDFGMTEVMMNAPWQATILTLVQNYAVTFYDASYHAPAILQEGTFVTADEKYLNRVSGSSHIRHLHSWPME
jgi:predicted nucleic acid-binding protein